MEMERRKTITIIGRGLVEMTYLPQTSAGVGCRIPIEWIPKLDALQPRYGVMSRADVLRILIGKELEMSERPRIGNTMTVDTKTGMVVVNPAPMAQANGASNPAERTLTPQERRVIFSKMDEVYDVNKGYDGAWTDFRLAEHLRLPLSFVRQVREEMFGPLKSNPEIDTALAHCQTFLEKLDDAENRAEDALQRAQLFYNNHLKGIKQERERIEQRMVEIKTSLGMK
jgi:hypothetical protein